MNPQEREIATQVFAEITARAPEVQRQIMLPELRIDATADYMEANEDRRRASANIAKQLEWLFTIFDWQPFVGVYGPVTWYGPLNTAVDGKGNRLVRTSRACKRAPHQPLITWTLDDSTVVKLSDINGETTDISDPIELLWRVIEIGARSDIGRLKARRFCREIMRRLG
jgi:hypothetical protein